MAQVQAVPTVAAEQHEVGILMPDPLRAWLSQTVQQKIEATNARTRVDSEGEPRRIGNVMLGMAPYAVLVALLPRIWATAAVWIWAQPRPVPALRRVHRIGWGRALGKSLVLADLHLMLILCGLVGLFVLGATSGT